MSHKSNGSIRRGRPILRWNTARRAPSRQRGVALFVGLVFLVVLSLIAVVVMKGTLLQMNMTNATAKHEQAFEASEAVRAIPEALLADHVFNRGWPVKWGGTVANSLFSLDTTYAHRKTWVDLLDPTQTTGQGLQDSVCEPGTLVYFYLPMSTCDASATDGYNYAPAEWAPSVKFITCTDGSPTCDSDSGKQIQNTIAIIRDGITLNVGSGAAMSQGYASVGVGTAKGGSALLLQLRSQSTVPGNGEATTIAQYKLNINN